MEKIMARDSNPLQNGMWVWKLYKIYIFILNLLLTFQLIQNQFIV